MAEKRLVIDLSMNLVNRTAVYDIGMELARLAPASRIRHWRLIGRRPLEFAATPGASVIGKALGRIAFKDVSSDSGPSWPRGDGNVLFVDPIFSRRTSLTSDDIVICHDVAPISHPEFYDTGTGTVYDDAYKRIQRAAPGMIFVSNFTRERYLEMFPADYRYSRVITLYFKPSLSQQVTTIDCFSEPYFLMVGGMERRKNFVAAIEAFLASGLPERGFRLKIAGPRGNLSAEVLPMIAETRSIDHLGYVGELELAKLYANSVALFFPSLVEGFGVPAVEATRLGTMAVVSRGTVLAEVVGPTGVTVDPKSIDSMAQGLTNVAALSAAERAAAIASVSAYQARFSIEAFRSNWKALLDAETS